MLGIVERTRILDNNLEYFGYSKLQAMENAGRGVADLIETGFGARKKVGIFCGPGNNGGDGMVSARFLSRSNAVHVFLVGGECGIKTDEARKNWKVLQKMNVEKTEIIDSTDVTLIKDGYDVIVDALLGVGADEPLREPILSVVRKINGLKGKKISIDIPTPGFKDDMTISIHCKKKNGAVVVDAGIPQEFETYVGPGDVLALSKPAWESHKGENGKLLVIGGSERYHGAILYSLEAASHFVDLVFFSSTEENNRLVGSIKRGTKEVIVIPKNEIKRAMKEVDCIVVGPGMGVSKETEEIVNMILKSKKRCVVDADGLKVADKKLLGRHVIVTPHSAEFRLLFGKEATKEHVEKMASTYGPIILKKGPIDIISDGVQTKFDFAGNQGMTKGGTGDVLAGLAGALACKNDLFLSACAAAFLNGLSGDALYERKGFAYNASDLVEQLPVTMKDILSQRYPHPGK